jgi:hypothetical protein
MTSGGGWVSGNFHPLGVVATPAVEPAQYSDKSNDKKERNNDKMITMTGRRFKDKVAGVHRIV